MKTSMIPHSRPRVTAGEIAAVARALRAGHISQGEEVARLEMDLSAMFGGSEVVAVSSGTAALYLALAALGVKNGRKVVIPSYTCRSLYAAVSHAGCIPVCADTGELSVCITPATVKPLLSNAVAAVIVPHMFGFTADVTGIAALGCPVIEDCAQAAGGRYADGSLLGTAGEVAILSFYGTKLMPAGEGGACVTRHKKLAATIRSLRNCDERPLDPRAFNFKMGDLNAALARAHLKLLPAGNKRRELIARRYDKTFGDGSFRNKSAWPQAVCFRYLLELSSQIRMKNFLEQAGEAGIACRRPVWEPLHYVMGGKCPQTGRLQNSLVSVPIYPDLSEAETEKICRTLIKLLA
jgi:dTDP-4-amino-4,6-dideoxygalactose transaminase